MGVCVGVEGICLYYTLKSYHSIINKLYKRCRLTKRSRIVSIIVSSRGVYVTRIAIVLSRGENISVLLIASYQINESSPLI